MNIGDRVEFIEKVGRINIGDRGTIVNKERNSPSGLIYVDIDRGDVDCSIGAEKESVKVLDYNKKTKPTNKIKTGLINVLGTDYNVQIKSIEEDEDLVGLSGYEDNSDKRIVIKDTLMVREKGNKADLMHYANKVVRHELVHAFMDEAGVGDAHWGHDELLVDWIAVMMPKMVVAMKDYM